MIEKWAQNNPEKIARLAGHIHALNRIGYSDEEIKLSFISQGMQDKDCDYLVKEAVGLGAVKAIGQGIMGAGKWLRGAGGSMAAKGAQGAQAAAKAGQPAGMLAGKVIPGAQQAVGKGIGRAGKAIGNAGEAFQANPLKAVGSGAWNMGQGALMGQGSGVGGAVGKGIFAKNMADMILPRSPQQNGNPYG